MSENGYSFPNNYQNNNDKNNDINGNKKRSLLDYPSTSEKYSKGESGSRGNSSSSPEKIINENPSNGATDEQRQIITRFQARSDVNNENENVEPTSDPLEKRKEAAGILKLLKKYRDKCGYDNEPYSILDSNDKIWFKAADITEMFGYSPQSNPIATINKENKSKFDILLPRNKANVSPANINPNTVCIDTDGIIDLICNSAKPECKKLLKWLFLIVAKNDTSTKISQNQIATVNNTNSHESELRRMQSSLENEKKNTAAIISMSNTHAENYNIIIKTNNILMKTVCGRLDNNSTLPTPSTSGLQDTQQVRQSLVSNSQTNDSSQQGFYILQNQHNSKQYKFFQRQLNSVKSSFNSFMNKYGAEYEKIYPNTEDPATLNNTRKAIDKVKEFLSSRKIPCKTVKTIMTIKSKNGINLQTLLYNYKVEF